MIEFVFASIWKGWPIKEWPYSVRPSVAFSWSRPGRWNGTLPSTKTSWRGSNCRRPRRPRRPVSSTSTSSTFGRDSTTPTWRRWSCRSRWRHWCANDKVLTWRSVCLSCSWTGRPLAGRVGRKIYERRGDWVNECDDKKPLEPRRSALSVIDVCTRGLCWRMKGVPVWCPPVWLTGLGKTVVNNLIIDCPTRQRMPHSWAPVSFTGFHQSQLITSLLNIPMNETRQTNKNALEWQNKLFKARRFVPDAGIHLTPIVFVVRLLPDRCWFCHVLFVCSGRTGVWFHGRNDWWRPVSAFKETWMAWEVAANWIVALLRL